MIISQGRNYIFVHAPKTGGTSMALALESRAMKDDILIGDTPKAQRRRNRQQDLKTRGRLWKHSTLNDIDGLLSPTQISRMFTFTLVRNPWDRMVSYYFWLRGQGFEHPAVDVAKQANFSGFLRSPVTERSFKDASYTRYMRAADGSEYCNLYIRLEHLRDDVAPLWDHLGFALTLPVENQSPRQRDYRQYYTPEEAALVECYCAEDIARFGYQFS